MIQAAKARLQLKKAIPFVSYLQLRIRKAAKAFDAWAWSCKDDGNAHSWEHEGKFYARNFTNDVWNCEANGNVTTWAGIYLLAEDRIDETAAEPLYTDDVVTPCFDSILWTCKMCTFINQPISRSCQMCGNEKKLVSFLPVSRDDDGKYDA